MFGELVGGEGYWGGGDKNSMVHLKENMSAFGMKFDGWRKAAQKAGTWFRREGEGAESFISASGMTRRAVELSSDMQRPRQHHPPSASLSDRGKAGRGGGGRDREGGEGEGGRGVVVPKRLKSGSGHHGLVVCGPSNGRHKLG